MNTVKVELQHPLLIGGATVGVVTLRRPKVRDLEALDRTQGEMQKSVLLIAHLAELDPDTVRELDAQDFAAVSQVIAGFLAPAAAPA